MKTISFYRSASGKCPIQDHLDTLTDNQVTKVAWVLKLIREIDRIPTKYFKKLVNTDDIWEVRIDAGKDTFRLLGFFYGNELIILTNSFQIGLWTKVPCCPWHEPQTKGVFYQILGNLARFMRSCIPIWALFYAFLSPVELLAGQERLLLPFQVNFHGVWAAWSLSQTL